MSATATAPTDDCIYAGVSAKHRSVFVESAAYFEIRPWYRGYEKLTLPGCVLYADAPMGDPSCFPSDLPDRLRELQRLHQAMDTTPGGWNPKGPVRQAHHDYELALFMELMGTPLRRSRRLADLSPASPAPPAWVASPSRLATASAPTLRRSARLAGLSPATSSVNVAAAAIGREAYRLYLVGSVVPDVADKELFDRLLYLTGNVVERIFLSGDSGRFQALTMTGALAWVSKNKVLLTMDMIRSWVHVPLGKWRLRNWTEEQVEMAMRQHRLFMATLEVAMAVGR